MVKIFVITGGPCSGKTSLVKALEKKGFNIIEEGARKLMEEKYKGKFWKNVRDSFQKDLLKFQLEKESQAKGMVFTDRGIPDAIAYYLSDNIKPFEKLLKSSKTRPYELVFFLEILNSYEKDNSRVEEREEMLKLHDNILKVYEERNYKIIKVPKMSITERVNFVVSHLPKES